SMIGPAPPLTGTRPRISGWVVNKISVDITSQQRICHSSVAPLCRALRVLVNEMTEIVVSAAGAYTGADIAAAARRELTGRTSFTALTRDGLPVRHRP